MQIRPQEGKQTDFLTSSADIVLYGGSAGGGKTYGLLMEAMRNIATKGFGAVIFRKSLKQIEKEGALWDTADTIYPQLGGRGVKGNLVFHWDAFGTKIDFAYLARDQDVYDWQGTQIPLICFDELTHFSKKQFFYMLSRNRSVCGVKPYIRATTNPDPDSWVREFIDWWIGDDGYAIEERSGVIRWFINQNDEIHWFDRKIDAVRAFPKTPPKSFTFITSNVHDNKILMEQDPSYIANLEALQSVERARLLHGNWDMKAGAGDYFKKSYFEVYDVAPPMVKIVRCWDLAGTEPSATNPDPDWTVGMKAGITATGEIWILDIVRERYSPAKVEHLIKTTSQQDGSDVYARFPRDVGSSGKIVAYNYVKMVLGLGRGYKARSEGVSGNKELRATPASAHAEIGNIKVLRGKNTEAFFTEAEAFPYGKHDDMVDALSDCVEDLTNVKPKGRAMNKPKGVR